MKEILPFQKYNICPKCGRSMIVRYYHDAEVDQIELARMPRELITTFDEPLPLKPERLACKCMECGYTWLEHTADYKPGEAEVKLPDGVSLTVRFDTPEPEHPTQRLDTPWQRDFARYQDEEWRRQLGDLTGYDEDADRRMPDNPT